MTLDNSKILQRAFLSANRVPIFHNPLSPWSHSPGKRAERPTWVWSEIQTWQEYSSFILWKHVSTLSKWYIILSHPYCPEQCLFRLVSQLRDHGWPHSSVGHNSWEHHRHHKLSFQKGQSAHHHNLSPLVPSRFFTSACCEFLVTSVAVQEGWLS